MNENKKIDTNNLKDIDTKELELVTGGLGWGYPFTPPSGAQQGTEGDRQWGGLGG